MFDLGRTAAILWVAWVLIRTRTWSGGPPLALMAYFFALGVASGISVREGAPQQPAMVLLLIFIGPTALPRGPLPRLPLSTFVTTWPMLANLVSLTVLALSAWRLMARSDALPAASVETHTLSRASLALGALAGFEALSGAARILPYVLDWGAGGRFFGDLPN